MLNIQEYYTFMHTNWKIKLNNSYLVKELNQALEKNSDYVKYTVEESYVLQMFTKKVFPDALHICAVKLVNFF